MGVHSDIRSIARSACIKELPVRVTRALVILTLLPMLAGLASCKPAVTPGTMFNVDTFQFVHSDPSANTGETVPYIWINSNTAVNLYEKTVKSSLPCAVMIDYTDNNSAFRAVVFTSVKITYDDGEVDPPADAVDLPLRIAARQYESVNSMAGGRIVKTKSSILSGRMPGVITRTEPFRLEMEGYFERADGSRSAFTIDQHFNIESETAVKSAAEALGSS